jgi:hypothetical protein
MLGRSEMCFIPHFVECLFPSPMHGSSLT